MEDVDVAPTTQTAAAVPELVKDSRSLQETWQMIRSQEIAALNLELHAAGLAVIEIANH
jgi:hypothetical protein